MHLIRDIRIFCTLCFCLLLTSCTLNNVFEIDKDENGIIEKFNGIQDLYNNGAQNVNIVFIHGMGYHPAKVELGQDGVTTKYQQRLADALGFSKVKEDYEPKTLFLRDNTLIAGGSLHRSKFNDENGNTLNMFALSWDEITEDIQKTLFELDSDFFERGGPGSEDREKERAYLNRELKRFINRSFADPAIYLGSFQKEIQYIIAQGINEIAETIIEGESSSTSSDQIVFISDSMGSSVTFDTVKDIMQLDKKSNLTAIESDLLKYKAGVQKFTRLSTLLFMNANQLPLIELGQLKAPRQGENKQQWLSHYPCSKVKDGEGLLNTSKATGILAFSLARKRAIEIELEQIKLNDKVVEFPVNNELQLVAFTDPNDPLSYYLTKRFKEHCSDDGVVHIVNVLLTNAEKNYLGILAHPGKAHASGFKDNDKAIELIVNGAH